MRNIAIVLFGLIIYPIMGQTFTTNRVPVGMEHNVLFNATTRYEVEQTKGNAILHLPTFFDGSFRPNYTTGYVNPESPVEFVIRGLPNVHIQLGAWLGWSTRGWGPKNFLIEGYNSHSPSGKGWKTLVDYRIQNYPNSGEFQVKVNQSGSYTQLRFTIYTSYGPNGRLGLSELYFIHPEATVPYRGLYPDWKIGKNDISYIKGNVGIGTVLAEAKLEVKKAGTIGGAWEPTKSYFTVTDGTQSIIMDPNEIYSNTKLHVGVKSGDIVEFRNLAAGSNQTKMIIKDNGNVGIGTVLPEAKLEVKKTGTIGNTWSPSKSYFTVTDGTQSIIMDPNEIYANTKLHIGVKSGDIVEFRSLAAESNQSKMIIKENGNVGIGIINPSAGLEIKNDNGIKIQSKDHRFSGEIKMTDGFENISPRDDMLFSTAGGFMFKMDKDNNGISRVQGFNVYDNTDKSVFSINGTNGNVGIGTINGQENYKLAVNGSIKVNENLDLNGKLSVRDSKSRAGDIISLYGDKFGNRFMHGFGVEHYTTYYKSRRIHRWYIASNHDGGTSAKMELNNSRLYVKNKVGIGVKNIPNGYELAVKGKIGAGEIKVESTTRWADFVFEEKYDLPTLKDVEKHINEKGHLKDIPSEKEVMKNGILLGEMNAKLLQKIEELTLYTIAQQKEIDKLKKEKLKNISLEKRLIALEKMINK